MSQEPKPLTYKLHDLGQDQKSLDTDGIPSMVGLFKHTNEPLGPLQELPFEIQRSFRGNLPVYTDLRNAGTRRLTVIKGIYGDVGAFKQELSKIVSNSDITEKMGRLEVSGIHSAKVKLWLTRLGF